LKAEAYYRVARFYWDMGYPRQAYTMIRLSVQTDSSFFVGLLWAWHYSVQLNAPDRARFYLRQLERIDGRNRIVRSYKAMASLFAGIRRERDHRKRSVLRIALAREYDSIDLPREALDNAQRAIAEDPLNRDAWETLADLFQERGQTIAAERARKRVRELE
jgi:tetratricopeptide (TPR) repeat protein